MTIKLLAALAGAAFSLAPLAATAGAACPGGASWCEDFEHGTGTLSGPDGTRPVPRPQGVDNHVLLLRAEGRPLLLSAGETAVHAKGAYFVEARLRPAPSGDSAPRQGYVIARYVDERNWLGFGLEFVPGSRRLGIAIVKMEDGKLRPLRKASAEIGAPGSFYTVRLDIAGSALTMYVNGHRITGGEEATLPAGRIGLVAKGGDVEFDDVRVGDVRVGDVRLSDMREAPSRIGLVRMNERLSLQAGEGAQRYAVRELARNGVATTDFNASSSDPAVAAASVDGDTLVVTPNRPGNATITLMKAGDNNVAVSLDTSVGAAFAASNRSYALEGKVLPAPHATEVQVDTLLQLRFDQVAALGASGSIRIYRSVDNAPVDVIRAGNEVNEIGASADGFRRVVRYNGIQLDGTMATIRPHHGRLAYDTEYYVLVDAGLFGGAALAGAPFSGIGKQAGWTFRTRAKAPVAHLLTVDDDGPADFRTVQGALDHVMRNVPREEPVTIRIANGRYGDLLYLRGKDNVTLQGESRDGAVIAVRNSDGLNPGSGSGQAASMPGALGGRAAFLIEDADLLHLDKLTVINTTLRDQPLGGQAEAINFASEGRLVATNASFFSEQDTILVKGWSWFYRSVIAGNVDFIWGVNHAALFEEDEIRTLGDGGKGGYIVQARTAAREDPGFVFLNSRLTQGPGPTGDAVPAGSVTLARPGTASTWDHVSYINCRMDAHIAPKGWTGQPRDGSGWYEYNSMDMDGKPLDLSHRVGGAVLSAAQAARFASRARVFAGFDAGRGWNPAEPAGQ
jgi:pectin methylesterase-like acyl-CoA thioesterase